MTSFFIAPKLDFMSVKVKFLQLINLSINEDYLKKESRKIEIISIEAHTMVIEVSSCVLAINNSVLVDFVVEVDIENLRIELTCKVIDFSSANDVGRISLKLVQYNKKDWAKFQNLMFKLQNRAESMLKIMRGK